MNPIRVNIDVETRSTCDLRKTSAKIYANDLSTDLVVVRYHVEGAEGTPQEWDCLRNPQIPDTLKNAILDTSIVLVAHNAGFEHAILTAPHLVARHGIPPITLDRWDDTAARAARMALPRTLEGSASALGLDVKKDMEGARVMMQLCKPRAWTADDEPIWWDHDEFADKYARLSAYCATDVEVGCALSEATRPLPATERAIWLMTEEINQTGLYVDWRFAEAARDVANTYRKFLDNQMKVITAGAVTGASKVAELKRWCRSKGYIILDEDDPDKELMDKGAVAKLLAMPDLPDDVRGALQIRRDAAKSSVAKYEAILNRVDRKTSRVRDTLMYHGASTGRWAGMGIQPQNFPRNVVKDWDACRADVFALRDERMSFDEFEAKHGPVMDVLSRMLRGTIHAPEGSELIFPDYSAVEARGVAWAAGASKLVNLFASGAKVYEEFAASIYGIPASEVKKDSTERFLAKTAVLGAGYGMGKIKFQGTCAAQGVEVSTDDAGTTINAYRTEYSEIPALWNGLEAAAIEAVKNPEQAFVYQGSDDAPAFAFLKKGRFLMMKLPSGRLLFYANPRVMEIVTPWGAPRQALEYSTVDSVTRKWVRQITWGGHLTENAVQGICRDLMAEAMLRLKAAGYKLVGTVHDEVIVEVENATDDDTKRILEILTAVPEWAKGFPLAAEATRSFRYGK